MCACMVCAPVCACVAHICNFRVIQSYIKAQDNSNTAFSSLMEISARCKHTEVPKWAEAESWNALLWGGNHCTRPLALLYRPWAADPATPRATMLPFSSGSLTPQVRLSRPAQLASHHAKLSGTHSASTPGVQRSAHSQAHSVAREALLLAQWSLFRRPSASRQPRTRRRGGAPWHLPGRAQVARATAQRPAGRTGPRFSTELRCSCALA